MKKRVWLTVVVLMACTAFLFMKLSTEEKAGYVYREGKYLFRYDDSIGGL
ncbi:hypothetical protein OC195_18575 [Priestia flexa]|nr:hypothetical protein OC195_18575 [Priestia flexa]